MELFNSLIRETEDILKAGCAKIWPYSPESVWKDIGANELVLQKDAAYELGARGKGSAGFILYTSNYETVPQDRILLYGPDLREIKGDCDFARIVILRIGDIEGDDETLYRTLKDIEFAKYHVYPEGYMVRISPESSREQVRVSKDALNKGISFRSIGSSYIQSYKKNENVLSVQVIFITDPSFDYEAMQKLSKKSSAVTSTLTHIMEGFSTDCTVCALKDICDEVEGMKELHFGVGDKGAQH